MPAPSPFTTPSHSAPNHATAGFSSAGPSSTGQPATVMVAGAAWRTCLGLLLFGCGVLLGGANLQPRVAAEPAPPDPAAEAPPSELDQRFFEERVRPLLAEHCHACHGAKKQQ
ncbi:MAG: hypothetical protein ACKOGA_09800, partial [Planctomycetaceae bacterium]